MSAPRRGSRRARAVLLALLSWGCASAPRTSLPPGEDYVFPLSAPRELGAAEAERLHAAWTLVLSGDAAGAERGFRRLLEQRPGLVPALAGLGYAHLRARRLEAAESAFVRALEARPDYVPALVGAGGVAWVRGDVGLAFERYRRAAELDRDDARIRKRLAEIKLRVTETRVAEAQAALARGEREAAVEAYRAALEAAPEVAGLRLELAELLLAGERLEEALALLAADSSGDRAVWLRLAALRESQHDYAAALEAYRKVLARDPDDAETRRLAQAAQAAGELQQMPPEYRHIFDSARLTRADLAALLAVKVTALRRLKPGQARVAVDVSGSWAREHILRLLSFDVLELYPNHTFQPAAVVRRGDLAQAVARVLDLFGTRHTQQATLSDMGTNHLFRAAAARVVGAGLMDVTPTGAFEPWRPVSGRDAADVVDALVRLIGP